MAVLEFELIKLDENRWEIPRTGSMLVPGRIYSSKNLLDDSAQGNEAVNQVVNVAHLPGIQKYSLAMPDIHWGYGFPIGGVAATDIDDGVISPGGVGYDINCGVRLAATSIHYSEIQNKIPKIIERLFNNIPTGVGAKGAIKKLPVKELKKILTGGSHWAVEQEFGSAKDISATEESGRMDNADPSTISQRAIERGLDQVGTLGSGNHFLEIDEVDEIYDRQKADTFGLFPGQVVIQIHTGSRGLGYQVCDDYLKILMNSEKRYGFHLPDKQLTCAPIKSEEGQNYLSAMKCAANFAWNNRQVIMYIAREVLKETISISDENLGFNLVYDVCHNIAKIEEHEIDGKPKTVCVHRKGATRAFPPGHKALPELYRSTGQPVLIPGDMGRYSFVAAGASRSMAETFGSSCHGAGRLRSRNKSAKMAKGRNLISELKNRGVDIRAKGMRTVAEEMPYAYKDVSEIVEVMHSAGITTKVARLKPVGVIKG